VKIKICSKCGKEKSIKEFYKDNNHSDKLRSDCKKCRKDYDTNRYIKNKILIIKKTIKYYKKNRIKILKRAKKYTKENRLEKKKYNDEYYEKNKIQLRESSKLRSAIYYQKNRNKKIKKTMLHHKKLRMLFPKYKVIDALRNRLWYALKGITKSLPTMMLIGCEIDYLMYHLQCRFTKGMSWDNYGDWHVDHIKPCSRFDLRKTSEQRKCFHYTNLQPLWAEDNRKKGNRR